MVKTSQGLCKEIFQVQTAERLDWKYMFYYLMMSWTEAHNPNRMSFFNARCWAGQAGNNPTSSCVLPSKIDHPVSLFLIVFGIRISLFPLFYTEIDRPVLWIEEESTSPKPPRLLSRLKGIVEFCGSGTELQNVRENISDENIAVILLNALPKSFNGRNLLSNTGRTGLAIAQFLLVSSPGDLAIGLFKESSSFLFLYSCQFSVNSSVAAAFSRHSWLTACTGGL
ncbi:hypothetical protein M9H77_17836 [Catharanthus roseus]|uniref:Uncharacterized protein n=1 Tax=Catharanthus roseus TaxID=4058 RepID=A0ACC0B5R2_CATRO|nr:hypothetical protein M9H77_17836 [Catharanthus roseus]